MSSSQNVPGGALLRSLVVAAVLLPMVLLATGCAAPEKSEQAQIQPTAKADQAAEPQHQPRKQAISKSQTARPQERTKAKPGTGAEKEAAAVVSEPRKPGCATPSGAAIPPRETKDGGMPKLAIADKVSVAPPVWPSTRTKHTFKLSNTGNAPLHINLKGG